MPKTLDIKKLEQVTLIGPGLLGGSVGLALRATGFMGRIVGVGRRKSSLDKALRCDAVDEATRNVEKGVKNAQLIVLCTPVCTFESLFRTIGPVLAEEAIVTDVASTKGEVVKLAERILPKGTLFVGSHPMAGSEKTGVEFARADLFERALCLVTPTKKTKPATVRWVRSFWEALGGRTESVDPRRHDELLARVSHLPHALATALVHLSQKENAIDMAGPGFADVTRVASGDPGMWTDILRTNRTSMMKNIDRLIKQLETLRDHLHEDDAEALQQWLTEGKKSRDSWIAHRYRKKVLPP